MASHNFAEPRVKWTRVITLEGPESWIKKAKENSLPMGLNNMGGGMTIQVDELLGGVIPTSASNATLWMAEDFRRAVTLAYNSHMDQLEVKKGEPVKKEVPSDWITL